MAVEGNLGDRMTIQLDPAYQAIGLWQHPLGTTLRLTFVDWGAGVQESASPNWVATEVVGRSEPYRIYIGTGPRQINMTFQFRAQGITSTDPRTAIENEVLLPARFLDALKYPLYSPQQELAFRPPPVLVRIGELGIWRCIVQNADIQWQFDPLDPDTLLPHGAIVPVTFEVVRVQQPDLSYFPFGAFGGPISGDWQ